MHSADWIIFKVDFLSKVFPLIAAFGPDGSLSEVGLSVELQYTWLQNWK